MSNLQSNNPINGLFQMSHKYHLQQLKTVKKNNSAAADVQNQKLLKRVQDMKNEKIAIRHQQHLLQQQQLPPQLPQQPLQPHHEPEDTPPQEQHPEPIHNPPPLPVKEVGKHRYFVGLNNYPKPNWHLFRSQNRLNFHEQVRTMSSQPPPGLPTPKNQDVSLEAAPLYPDVPLIMPAPRTRSKSVSNMNDLNAISQEDANTVASAVLHVLDKKEAERFVIKKLLKQRQVSRIALEEISTAVQLSDLSGSTDISSDSSNAFYSPSEDPNQSLETSPLAKTPPNTVLPVPPSPPKKSWKSKLRAVNQNTTAYAHLLWQPPPSATTAPGTSASAAVSRPQTIVSRPQPVSTPSSSTVVVSSQQPLASKTPEIRQKCLICDNSRFFVFSPETRQSFRCSCGNLDPEIPLQPQQQPQEDLPQRRTRSRGVRKGVWDRINHTFKKF